MHKYVCRHPGLHVVTLCDVHEIWLPIQAMEMLSRVVLRVASSWGLASDVFDRVQAASCPHEVRDVGAFHDRAEAR